MDFSPGLYQVVEGFTDGEMPARWEIGGDITCESVNTDAGSHASIFRHTSRRIDAIEFKAGSGWYGEMPGSCSVL